MILTRFFQLKPIKLIFFLNLSIKETENLLNFGVKIHFTRDYRKLYFHDGTRENIAFCDHSMKFFLILHRIQQISSISSKKNLDIGKLTQTNNTVGHYTSSEMTFDL